VPFTSSKFARHHPDRQYSTQPRPARALAL